MTRVGVHDDLAADVPGRPADHLDERPGRPQEALLVGVEDRDERHLGQVDALAQQVDPDEDVEDAEAQVAQDRHALERVHLAVEVLDLDPELLEVVGQVLGHLLGQGRDEGPLALLDPAADLLEQVVDLALGRADLMTGSTMPVGRMSCWTTRSLRSSSYGPGVALM